MNIDAERCRGAVRAISSMTTLRRLSMQGVFDGNADGAVAFVLQIAPALTALAFFGLSGVGAASTDNPVLVRMCESLPQGCLVRCLSEAVVQCLVHM